MAKRKKALIKETAQEEPMLIRWNIPETIITRFASNMVVQNIEGYFKLSFFELKPEIHLTTLKTPPTEIVADCVGSVMVPPDKLPAFIDVLMKQLQKHQITQDQLKVAVSSEIGQSLL
ncbi:MAG: hypothetical protein Q7J15_00230 [Candidatus Desulfaltia sp.]|nr:hypothetical protein [Candidatus Desulfaltia sp.]